MVPSVKIVQTNITNFKTEKGNLRILSLKASGLSEESTRGLMVKQNRIVR